MLIDGSEHIRLERGLVVMDGAICAGTGELTSEDDSVTIGCVQVSFRELMDQTREASYSGSQA